MAIDAILWDFGDTLCDERWMLSPLGGAPRWPEAYRSVLDAGGLADRWNMGRVGAAEVAEEFARSLDIPAPRILAHMRACCRNVAFYPAVMDLAAGLALPQAIVTVNPDLFSEVVVPAYGLEARFDTIVTSWQEGTVSKADLCEAALSRLPGALEPGRCLLIDNRLENLVEWRARGGLGLHFEDDASLGSRLARMMGDR